MIYSRGRVKGEVPIRLKKGELAPIITQQLHGHIFRSRMTLKLHGCLGQFIDPKLRLVNTSGDNMLSVTRHGETEGGLGKVKVLDKLDATGKGRVLFELFGMPLEEPGRETAVVLARYIIYLNIICSLHGQRHSQPSTDRGCIGGT